MKKRLKRTISGILVILIFAISIIWIMSKFIHFGNVEYTDNAQVNQHIVPVNSRIQGFIKEIRFEEYGKVKKGDTLIIIEDTEFRLRLAQAEADYENSIVGKTAMGTTINTTSNNLAVSDAIIEEARILLEHAEKELERYGNLLSEEAVTQQKYDQIKTTYDAQKAKYEMLCRQRQTTALVRTEQTQRLSQNEAVIEVTSAALDLAKLNLSYTIITAPCDGYTTRKDIQIGQLVQSGQTLIEIVDDSEIWVIANYKESQLKHIREGMPVSIKIDAIDDVVYNGEVESISKATGAKLSLLPQDNSAGNFVKVEQRVPVRIKFTDNNKESLDFVRAGLNVECEIEY